MTCATTYAERESSRARIHYTSEGRVHTIVQPIPRHDHACTALARIEINQKSRTDRDPMPSGTFIPSATSWFLWETSRSASAGRS